MIFKKGDRVFDAAYGWGEVVKIGGTTLDPYIVVEYEGMIDVRYTHFCMLSFTEYTLEGFSQERPLPFKVGDVVYLKNGMDRVWVVTILIHIVDGVCPFQDTAGSTHSLLALENPLKKPDTKIYTREDL